MANTAGTQVAIGNGQTLNDDAARHWLALVNRILTLHGIVILATSGTRPKSEQARLYDGWVRRLPGFNPAWPPDSPFAYHVSGRAVDVGSGVGYLATLASQAFYALAGLYGFRPTVQGEPWHFEWRAEWVGIALEVADVVATPIPHPAPTPDQKETDMNGVIVTTNEGDIWVCDLAQKTKWNVLAGLTSTDVAVKRAGTYNRMGLPWFKNQPPSTVQGLTDITNR